MSYALTPSELSEWTRRTAPDRMEREPREALKDPIWRLGSGKLYRCLSKIGRDVTFLPTPEQRLVIWCIIVRGWRRLIIPKARQLGMSLVLCLIGLDFTLFAAGFKAALVDKTGPDADKKLAEKLKFAADRLPAAIRQTLEITALTQSISAKAKTGGDPASKFEAGITFRGGTVEWLHISEWGEIQASDYARSREIRDGSLPAAEEGIVVVETTWKGGLDRELGPFVVEAQSTPEAEKTAKSWRVMFFSWQTDPAYAQDHGYIDPLSAKHFADCEAMGATFTRRQKLWYAEQIRTKGMLSCKSQFPTFEHECWETVPEGSIYGALIEGSRATGQVLDFPIADLPVDTWWDIGLPINTACWFTQEVGAEIRVIGLDFNRDVKLSDRFASFKAMGYQFRGHYLPHDAGIELTSGRNQATDFRLALEAAGLTGAVHIVPRVAEEWQGINDLKNLWPRLVFHATNCREALKSLAQFSFKRETSSGRTNDKTVHDRHSHPASALRQLGQYHAGTFADFQSFPAPPEDFAMVGGTREQFGEDQF